MNKYVELFMLEHDLYEGDLFNLIEKPTNKVIMEDLMFMNGELTHKDFTPSAILLNQVLDTDNYRTELNCSYSLLKYVPKDKDPYWYIAEGGNIVMTLNYGSKSDEWLFKTHHVFRCERHVKDYKAFLLDVGLYSKPFKIGGDNYCIKYCPTTNEVFEFNAFVYRTQGTIYFGIKDNIKQFINTVGEDRIKKYMFDVWN